MIESAVDCEGLPIAAGDTVYYSRSAKPELVRAEVSEVYVRPGSGAKPYANLAVRLINIGPKGSKYARLTSAIVDYAPNRFIKLENP